MRQESEIVGQVCRFFGDCLSALFDNFSPERMAMLLFTLATMELVITTENIPFLMLKEIVLMAMTGASFKFYQFSQVRH